MYPDRTYNSIQDFNRPRIEIVVRFRTVNIQRLSILYKHTILNRFGDLSVHSISYLLSFCDRKNVSVLFCKVPEWKENKYMNTNGEELVAKVS